MDRQIKELDKLRRKVDRRHGQLSDVATENKESGSSEATRLVRSLTGWVTFRTGEEHKEPRSEDLESTMAAKEPEVLGEQVESGTDEILYSARSWSSLGHGVLSWCAWLIMDEMKPL